jgi:hypothetical protein
MITITTCKHSLIGESKSFVKLAAGVFHNAVTGAVVVTDGDDAVLIETKVRVALTSLPEMIDEPVKQKKRPLNGVEELTAWLEEKRND